MKEKISKQTEEKIIQLQLLEQNLQNFLMQKQTYQTQLFETENALNELEKTKKDVYKIVGNVMIHTSKEELKKDLDSKREIINIRIKNIDKQEENLKKKATEIQSEVIKELKKE